jgi:radical SAM superfamily enzyme YgiQ (UPF0313 family)
MATVFIKPNTKKAHYGNVAGISAVEPPAWLMLFSQTVSDSVVVDMEAEGLDHEGLVARLRPLQIERVVILATGSHPSAHIQQAQAARALKPLLTDAFMVPVEVYDRLPFDPLSVGALDWSRISVERYRAHNWHRWGSKDRFYGATFASISCPFSCDFCCVKDFYGAGYAQRKPGLVVADVRALVARGVTHIKMMDELFAIDNPGVRAVCDELALSGLAQKINIWAYARIDTVNADLLKKMRSAGVRWLAYGIESGDEKIRAGVTKGKFTNARIREVIAMTKDADIHVVGNFMFGFWDDDLTTMRRTLDFAKELACEYANFYCMSVYEGSKLYDEMKTRGVDLPVTGEEYAQMSPKFKPVPTAKLSGREVLTFRDAAFMEYFTDEKYLAMMERVLGMDAADEIRAMTAIDIRSKT